MFADGCLDHPIACLVGESGSDQEWWVSCWDCVGGVVDVSVWYGGERGCAGDGAVAVEIEVLLPFLHDELSFCDGFCCVDVGSCSFDACFGDQLSFDDLAHFEGGSVFLFSACEGGDCVPGVGSGSSSRQVLL